MPEDLADLLDNDEGEVATPPILDVFRLEIFKALTVVGCVGTLIRRFDLNGDPGERS
jgi:hypothetical protein